MKTEKILTASMTIMALAALGGTTYDWNPLVYTGSPADGSSWASGVVPGGNDQGRIHDNTIKSAAEYVVKIPAGGFVDPSATFVHNLPHGTKVTFDATGTTWTKLSESGTAWNGCLFRFDGADHFFNIENLNVNNANDNFGFTLSNGKISFLSDGVNGDRLVFESGVFNNYEHDGQQNSHTTIIMHNGRLNSKIVMKPGSETHLRQVEVRGQTPGGEWLIEGGEHHVFNGLAIKTYGTGNAGRVHVTGGDLYVDSSAIWLGKNAAGPAYLDIEGTGAVHHNGNAVYFPDVAGEQGYLRISGNGSFVSKNSGMSIGHQTGSMGLIELTGAGRLEVTNTIQLAEGGNSSTGLLHVADNAFVYVSGLNGANGADRYAEIRVEDNATLMIGNGTLSNNDTSHADFTLAGGRIMMLNGGLYQFGDNHLGTVTAKFTGGVVDDGAGGDSNGYWNFKGGPGSEYIIDGADIHLRSLIVEGPQQNLTGYTNTVVLKSGKLSLRRSGAGDGLDVRGNKRNAMFLVEGGEFNLGDAGAGMLRLGHAGAAEGFHAVFRQTGGVVREDCVVNMCDSANADGEFELLGGVFYGRDIRGWNGSCYRNPVNTGWARCYFNGGTLKPIRNNVNLIYTMPECSVGPLGLTLDTEGFDTTISARFQNDGAGTADEVEGLFVKAGMGKLTLRMVETDSGAKGEYAGRSLVGVHSATRVKGGTLAFSDAAGCAFGKNLSIEDGAVVTLAGTAATLTVDTLALGNGKGMSTLRLDLGDQVVVNDAHGVSGTNGFIAGDWTGTNGTYPIFVCRNGASLDDFAGIAVLDAVGGKDYYWTSSEDGDGNTVVSLVIANAALVGDNVWTGADSSAWDATGNWSEATVPTRANTARFGNVANQTVQTAAGATAGKLEFTTGDYAVQGTETLSVAYGIESSAGTQTFTAPVRFGRIAEIEVAVGSEIDFTGDILGTGTDFIKSGSGKVVLSGGNEGFYGRLVANGGTLQVGNAGAFGPDAALTYPVQLRSGTFCYAGTSPATVDAALDFAADDPLRPVVLDNASDLTFTDVTHTRGILVKKGAGTLAFNLPKGTFTIGSNANDANIGENGGTVQFNVNGDSPVTTAGLYGLNILEGALRVTGQGTNVTTFSSMNTSLIGGGYMAQTAPGLEVENAYVNFGSGSRHSCLMRDYPAGAVAPFITLRNAYLFSDSMTMGRSVTSPSEFTLTMRNSTFFNHYNSQVGGLNITAHLDVENSKFYSDAMVGWTVQASELDADFRGPETMFGSINAAYAQNEAGRIAFADRVTGRATFRDGARLTTTRGVKMNNASLDMVFDGGIFQVLPNPVEAGTSTWTRVGSAFTAQGAGLSFEIAAGTRHVFDIPIGGTGTVTVATGTLQVTATAVADTVPMAVAENAALDLGGGALAAKNVSGTGTVQNGTLATPILAMSDEAVLNFANAEFPLAQAVQLELAGAELAFGERSAVVAKLGEGCSTADSGSIDVSGWKATVLNAMVDGKYVDSMKVFGTFTYDSTTGLVSLTYQRPPRSTIIYIR